MSPRAASACVNTEARRVMGQIQFVGFQGLTALGSVCHLVALGLRQLR